jgi:hypothetical protein
VADWVLLQESNEMSGSRGEANFVWKCKNCKVCSYSGRTRCSCPTLRVLMLLFPDGGGQVADGSSESQLPVSRLLLCRTSKGVRRRV